MVLSEICFKFKRKDCYDHIFLLQLIITVLDLHVMFIQSSSNHLHKISFKTFSSTQEQEQVEILIKIYMFLHFFYSKTRLHAIVNCRNARLSSFICKNVIATNRSMQNMMFPIAFLLLSITVCIQSRFFSLLLFS